MELRSLLGNTYFVLRALSRRSENRRHTSLRKNEGLFNGAHLTRRVTLISFSPLLPRSFSHKREKCDE